MFSAVFSEKLYEKTTFLIQIYKVHVRIYCIAKFHDLEISTTKMTDVSI